MNIDQAFSEIKRKAESGLGKVYTDLRREIRANPGAAPASERFAMNAFFSALSADARLLIIDALERDGVEHSALEWTNSIVPKLQKPRFEYLQVADVYARVPPNNEEKHRSRGTRSKSSSQFIGKGLGAAAGSLGVGAGFKLAGAALNVPLVSGFLSGVGTVCLFGAVAIGGFVLYSAFRSNDDRQRSYEKTSDFSSVPVQNISFDDIIDNQLRNNRNALNRWGSDLEHLAHNIVQLKGGVR